MKEQLTTISDYLNRDIINEEQALVLLFDLLHISELCFKEGDCITNGISDAILMTKPTLKADIIWMHNDVYDNDRNVNGFTLIK